MLLITKRRKIGTICGHAVYAITKSEMIPIPNSTVQSNMNYSKNENRSFVFLHVYVKYPWYFRPMLLEFGNTYIPLYPDEIVFQFGDFILRSIEN